MPTYRLSFKIRVKSLTRLNKFNAYRPLKLKRKEKRGTKKKKKYFAYLPTLFQNKGEIVNKTFFLGLMSTHSPLKYKFG